ncbi:hypothetical protein FHS39_002560 [Streptomyces olivoverticillatus]|uniref:Uncharacterized protein n=1 Tax=Streptomyces olivoverticillatus TaxID=66427 RepID=A0A7W7LNJ3_9ACTN|nr:hypothetical protein [Streptomyces olivoverticillatus]MBB4893529.1 hypothetical protein [Streptomyces olivoverticillatus]
MKRLLAVVEGWSRTTSVPGSAVVARLEIVTESGAAVFVKLSRAQVERLGHMFALDDSVQAAHNASVNGGGHAND